MANKVEFGISNLYVGTYTVGTTGSVTMGTPYHQAGAISFSPEEQSEANNFYADNGFTGADIPAAHSRVISKSRSSMTHLRLSSSDTSRRHPTAVWLLSRTQQNRKCILLFRLKAMRSLAELLCITAHSVA